MTELMIEWQHFLLQQGANFSDEAFSQLLGFNGQSVAHVGESDFVAPLTDLGLLAWSGDEAAHFLHNQLTNDVENLGANTARLAGYCSPKGRLLATTLYWQSDNHIMLQLPRQLLAPIQKRLQMFVLRAKAKCHDASNEFVILGLAGHGASTALQKWFPLLPTAAYDKQDSEAGTLIRLPDTNGAPRFQWISSPATAIQAWPLLTQSLRASGPQAWRLADIRAGIPTITPPTQEQFVPQMVNFELIGGVNFKKGCYPGQEIVARSQYLGKLKRRMLLASVSSDHVIPGMEVFAANDPEQPCGMIVNAEVGDANTAECLVEIKLAATEGTTVHLGSAQGSPLAFKPLPYTFSDPTQ
jgi:folate-binding protein YgfZ